MSETPITIADLRKRVEELAPAGRNAFPAICGLSSLNGGSWEPAGIYSEDSTLKAIREVFLRMLDAAEGIEAYRPSNGTEGEMFMSRWCARCAKDNLNPDTGEGGCEIIANAFAFDIADAEYPREWRYVDGEPVCAAFEALP